MWCCRNFVDQIQMGVCAAEKIDETRCNDEEVRSLLKQTVGKSPAVGGLVERPAEGDLLKCVVFYRQTVLKLICSCHDGCCCWAG